jgi:hypothetical protein
VAISTRTMSRRELLAAIVGATGAALAGTMAKADRLLAAGSDGDAVTVGAHYNDVRSPTRFETAGRDSTTVMSFGSVDAEGNQHKVEIGPAGLRSRHTGHWSHGTVTIDGAVEAIGGGAEAAGGGPMVVGRGDSMGVHGAATGEGPGVQGIGTVGVAGVGTDRGGVFVGNVAQLQLRPSDQSGHPRVGEAGDLFVDGSRRLWFCAGGEEWRRVA